MATVTLKGNPIHTNGELPKIGAKAPDFKLTTGDLKDVSLAEYKGKRKVLNIVPSLDTPTCATSTRKFNERAGKLANTVVLVVSADLPFASKRFCTTEGLQNVTPLSLMRDKNFAKDYGVLIQDGPLQGVTARAVVVVAVQESVGAPTTPCNDIVPVVKQMCESGVTKQVDFAVDGKTVVVKRTVKDGDKVLYRDTFNSNYRPWQARFLVGTRK